MAWLASAPSARFDSHGMIPNMILVLMLDSQSSRYCRARASRLTRPTPAAHHWQRLLDERRAASVAEIAEAEGMDVTQVRRVMRLTLLAPEVVEWLVDSPDAMLEQVMRRPWPNGWGEQMRVLAPPA